MTKKPYYADVADHPEDKRIDIIGNQAMTGAVVGFIVESENNGEKGDRYIAKLARKFPKLIVRKRAPGPIDGCEAIQVCLPTKDN